MQRARGIAGRPVVISGGATVLIQFGNLVTGVVLARALGPEVRGHVAALAALSLSVAILTGLSLAEASMFIGARNAQKLRAAWGSFLVILLLTMTVAMGVLVAATPLLMQLGATSNFADVAPWILCAGLSQTANFVQMLARSLERFSAWFWLRVMGTWIYALLLFALAITVGLNARWAGIALCASALAVSVAGARLMFRRVFPITPSREIAGQIIRYGAKMHPATIALLARDQLDKVILILVAPAGEVGKYVVAIALSSLIVSGAYSVDQAIFPKLSAILDFGERRSAYLHTMRRIAPLLALAAPAILLTSPAAAALAFGRRFADQPWLIAAGAALGLLSTVKVLANIGLKIENQPGVLGANEAAGSIVGLVALPFAVKAIGIMGAPLASGLGCLVSLAFTLRALLRQYSGPRRAQSAA